MTFHKLTIELGDHELQNLMKVKQSWDKDEGFPEEDEGFSLEYVAATIVATYKEQSK